MKVFLQRLLKGIGKYKKMLIYSMLALFVGQFFLFDVWWIWVQSNVYADNTATYSDYSSEKMVTSQKKSESYTSVVYVVLYPLLVLAGKLVDNSLVYGSVFNFDAILWNLWNVVRNLANFALGFFFLRSVLKMLWKKDSKYEQEIKGLLLKSLIAWVWIQASWFIMAALIDVSTILTYWVWWLPISTLGNTTWSDAEYNPYVYSVAVLVDWTDASIDVYITNTWWAAYISECDSFTYVSSGGKEELLIAPKNLYYTVNNEPIATEEKICYHDFQIYDFNETLVDRESDASGDIGMEKWEVEQVQYEASLKDKKVELSNMKIQDIQAYIEQWQLLQIGDAHLEGWIVGNIFTWISYSEDQEWWFDKWNQRMGNQIGLGKLSDLLENSKNEWFLWVFANLYSSLMNIWNSLQIWDSTSNNTFVLCLNAFLKLFHMLAIWIPLLVMVVVLWERILILWIAIAMSPAIVLSKTFWWGEKINNNILKHLKVDNLIWIIFSPVVVCLAVSLSAVLVSVISNSNYMKIDYNEWWILWGLIRLFITDFSYGVSFWKVIMSAICIVVTWFLMRFAIEMNSLWKWAFAQNLKKFAQSTLWSINFIPIPWKDAEWRPLTTSVNSLFGHDGSWWLLSQAMWDIERKFNTEQEETVQNFLNREAEGKKVEEKRVTNYMNAIPSMNIGAGQNWMELSVGENNKKFVDFTPESKERIIEKINSLNVDVRKKFGESVSKIEFADRTYEFDTNENKYNKKEIG